MKDLADEQSGFYSEIGIFLRPATSTGLGRMPCGERLLSEPDRDIATLAQRFVIFRPVGHLVTRFLDLVSAVLLVFVRQRFFCRSSQPPIMPDRPPLGERSIYSTTPRCGA